MIFKLVRKLKQIVTDDARHAKPMKTTMNHDIDEILLFTTKVYAQKMTTDQRTGQELGAAECPKHVKGRHLVYFNVCKYYEKLSTHPNIQRTKETYSLCIEQ